ncbi:MAG: hypothetical protein WCU00_02615 [Candidatus Latescibacterota bacterium]
MNQLSAGMAHRVCRRSPSVRQSGMFSQIVSARKRVGFCVKTGRKIGRTITGSKRVFRTIKKHISWNDLFSP